MKLSQPYFQTFIPLRQCMSDDILLIENIPVEDTFPEGGLISIWTLNRPDKLNSLNSDSHKSLKEACEMAESNDLIRVIVISGAPPNTPLEGRKSKPFSFAAGADISEFVGKNSDDVRPFFEDNAWERVWNLSKPTIGLIPGGGGTQRLCRLIGYGKALEMVLTGDMIDSEEALSYGLVNSVTSPEQLKKTTMQLAENIARKSPYTTKVAKRAVRASLDLPFSEGVRMERSEFVALFDTEDKEIGVNAFLNRESPKWLGK